MPDNDQPPNYGGVLFPEWEASHDRSIAEYPASRFIVFQNGQLVRIAFGQYGYPVNPQGQLSPPRYNAAVSMAPAVAMQLRDVLNGLYPPQAASPAAGEPESAPEPPIDPRKLS